MHPNIHNMIDKIIIKYYNLNKRSDEMIKSVYSLMLFDEIVEKIDQIAYENNTNRSQLINDILAEKIGLVTPEQKI